MPSKLRDFVEVWQDLPPEGKDKALKFLIKAYGDKLFDYLKYLRFIDNNTGNENKEKTNVEN